MRTWITLALLATLTSCTHVNGPAAHTDLQARQAAGIQRIENGLVEFTSPMAMFSADRPAGSTLVTLSDRMTHYRVPAVSVAVIQQSRLAWAKSWGVLRSGEAAPATTDSTFQAASTSKTVAAAIVMHFVDKGVLRLDEDVNTYLRSWRIPDSELTREKKVTLRLLLTHQAGLPSGNFAWDRAAAPPTLVQVLRGELPAKNKPAVVELTPGSRWQYSNLGFVVIQQVLEDVAGKPYGRIAQEVVFRPLGMTHSTFDHPSGRTGAGEAMPHDAEGTLREPQLPPTAVAQGGLMTTPSDLALFAAALIDAFHGRPNPLLSREAARRMFRKELDLDPKMFGGPFGEGLGVFLHGEGEDLAVVSPGSNLPGTNCWLVVEPARESGVVVMTNGAQGEVLAMEIIGAVRRESAFRAAADIVTRCAMAMGGAERIRAWRTLRVGVVYPDHGTEPIASEILRPNRIRTAATIFDGAQGYLQSRPATGARPARAARLFSPEESKDFEIDVAWFVPAFFDHPARYLGDEVVDGVAMHKLGVTLPLGASMVYFVDPSSFLVRKATSEAVVDGKIFNMERTFLDFRPVDGLVLPHAFLYPGREGATPKATVDRFEVNVPLSDQDFRIPSDAEGAAEKR